MLKRLMAVVVLTGIFCCGVATPAMAAENDAAAVERNMKYLKAFKLAGDMYDRMLSLKVKVNGGISPSDPSQSFINQFKSSTRPELFAGLRDVEAAFIAAGVPNGLFLVFGQIVGRVWDIEAVASNVPDIGYGYTVKHDAEISVESVTPEEIVRVIDVVVSATEFKAGSIDWILNRLSTQERFLDMLSSQEGIF